MPKKHNRRSRSDHSDEVDDEEYKTDKVWDEDSDEAMGTPSTPSRPAASAVTPLNTRSGLNYATPLKQKEIIEKTIADAMKTPKIAKQKQRRKDSVVYLSAFGIRAPVQRKKWVGKREWAERGTESPCTKGVIDMLSRVTLNTPPPLKRQRKEQPPQQQKRETLMEASMKKEQNSDSEEDIDLINKRKENDSSDEDWDAISNGDEDDTEIRGDDDDELFKEFQEHNRNARPAASTPSPIKKTPHRAFLMKKGTPGNRKTKGDGDCCFISPIQSTNATPITGKPQKTKFTKAIREKYNDFMLERSFNNNGGGDDEKYISINEWYKKIYKESN